MEIREIFTGPFYKFLHKLSQISTTGRNKKSILKKLQQEKLQNQPLPTSGSESYTQYKFLKVLTKKFSLTTILPAWSGIQRQSNQHHN